MRTGLCKFGASCKYYHPRQGVGSSTTVPLNISGYPPLPCKFGVTCKFYHPQPTTLTTPQDSLPSMVSAIYPNMQSPVAGNWPLAKPSLPPGSHFLGTYGPMILPPGMVPFPGWNP